MDMEWLNQEKRETYMMSIRNTFNHKDTLTDSKGMEKDISSKNKLKRNKSHYASSSSVT